MSRHLRPCRNGPSCGRGGLCDFFHGTELYKSHKPCRYGATCRFMSECVWLHPGEGHLVGKVFWRAAAPARAPVRAAAGGGAAAPPVARRVPVAAPEDPEPTGPPAPLDDYAFLENIKGFLCERDYMALRRVNKSLCDVIDTHAQLKKVKLNIARRVALPSLDFVTEIEFVTDRSEYWTEPRPEHLARLATAPMLEKVSFDVVQLADHVDAVARLRTIKYVKIADSRRRRDQFFASLVAAIPNWPNLEKLKIVQQIPASGVTALLEALSGCAKLKSLELCFSGDAEVNLAPLRAFPALRSLALSGLSERALAEASQLRIKKLRFHGCAFSRERMDPNPHVKELHITGSFSPVDRLTTFVRGFPELEELDISSASEVAYHESDPDTGRWSWPWEGLKKLKTLTAGSLNILDRQFPSFCAALPNGLEELFIHGMDVRNYQPLIENLRRLKLWSLGLNGNRCDAVEHLARALVEFAPELQQIGFTICDMEYAEARAALMQLREIKTLRQVYMYTKCFKSTRIQAADYSNLRALLRDTATVLISDNSLTTHIKKKF